MCFPIVLTLILAVIQIAHLWIAKQVVHYAAFSAARVAMVTSCVQEDPSTMLESLPNRQQQLKYTGFNFDYTRGNSIASGRNGFARSEAEYFGNEAAARICSALTLSSSIAESERRTNSTMAGTDAAFEAARRKTRAIVEFNTNTWNIAATVEHDFALVVPIVGQMLGWGLTLWGDENTPAYTLTEDETGDFHTNTDAIAYPHIRLTGTVLMSKPYRTIIAAGDWQGAP